MLLSNLENPLQPPKDPPCCPPPPQISELINSSTNSNSPSGGRSSSDDVDGDDNNNNNQLQLVDLFKSDHHPPPKFSIRDYVFNTRSKDIENNWPFSEENLQLCLKHGLKDLLPPFQSPHSVRKPSSLCNSKTHNQNDHGVLVDYSHNNHAGCSNQNIAVGDCSQTNPKGFQSEGGSKEFPSTIITSQTCSEITSVPTNRSPEFGTDNFQELSPPRAKKTGVVSKSQVQVKKCRLVVKLGNNSSNLTTKEDGLMVSEVAAMASSKVCPVCKTFSSSSNTTLNAHIDQCLSGESTATKCSLDAKVIKHKIKPRKIKSMVDIYATALHCTLEELDRRNGTNWANTKSSLPAQENEAGSSTADQKKKQARWLSSPANSLEENPPDEGAVYIDANGTKVRILSKPADPSLVLKAVDGDKVPPKKFVNRDKVSKFLLSKKKKQNQVQKRHKLVKHGKMSSTFRPHLTSSKINDNHDRNSSREENLEEEACITRHFKSPTEVEFNRRPDVVCGWVCSKRTGLTKRSNGRDERDLVVETDRLSLGNSNVQNSCGSGRRTSHAFETSLPRNSKQIEKLAYDPCDDEYREMPVRKRSRVDVVESPVSFGKEKVLNVKQARKDKSRNGEDCLSSVCKRKVQVYADEDRNVDRVVVDPKNSCGQDMHSAKGKMFSSLRNKSFSGQESKPDKMNFKRKFLAFKKSSGVGYDHDRIGRTHGMVSVDGVRNLKARKSWGEGVSAGKTAPRRLKTLYSAFMSYDAEEQDGSFVHGSSSESRSHHVESAGMNTDTSDEEDFEMETPSGDAFMNFRDQLASSSDLGCNSRRFSDEALEFEDEPPACSAEPLFNDGEGMFCAGAEAVPENMNVVAELESSGTHGNYFVDVDPIPIPGPPGSFLPSPGHMDSEDLPGNSSLTSSRIQSSDDRQELVDQSSDSPVSAISAISSSTLAKSDSKSSGTMMVGCPGQALDGLGNGNVESSSPVLVDNTSTAGGAERTVLGKYHEISLSNNEKVVYEFKDHHPPCCCSRKEGYSQNISLNYEESQLLKRRTMTAADVMAATRKEVTCDRPEMLSANGCNPGDRAAIQRIAADSSLLRFPIGDAGCEPNSPAAPSPVLRLMGKNLMVVNKDDQSVVSSQMKLSQLSPIIGHSNPGHVLPVSGVPIISQAPYSLEPAARSNNAMQRSEWSDGRYTGRENVWTASQMLPVTSPTVFSSRGAVLGGLAGSSSMHPEYIHGYNLSATEQRHPTVNGMVKPSANFDADEHCSSPPSLRWRNTANGAPVNNAAKEIIVIDDSPENDHLGSMPARTAHGQGPIQDANLACGSRSRAISLYGYPQYGSAATYSTGSPVDASFRMQTNNVINVNGSSPGKWMNWGAAAEGSSAMHQSPLMTTTPSSAAAQLRPKFYNYSNLK
ncbi:OLC1v1022348C1 [Oldenlandia corymbosa var. corymbosa]|uniref:OLC1v1022348C1 n=1 Tax=Oldenlandia corymbosa var. corymbosa TaxID=529605 RepID=A0AAV1BXP1_OLDCO|nr:OLC1v1022348C1 [Oldenlandia corymbosa var. corymbosa]